MTVSPTSAPRGIAAHWHTGNWIRLTWEPIRAANHYEFEHEYSGGVTVAPEPRTDQFAVSPGATAWCRIRNVACNEPSAWIKVTVNDRGEIVKKQEEGNDPPPPPPPTPPQPPAGLQVVSTDPAAGKATVAWAEANDAERWEVLLENHGQYQPAATPEHVFTGLTGGVDYGWRVRAVNSSGTSAPTRGPAFRLDKADPQRPNPPRNLRATEVGADFAVLSWDAPQGGSPVEHYHLAWSKADAANTSGSGDAKETSFRVTGLDPASDYGAAVYAAAAGDHNSQMVTTQWRTKNDDPVPPPPPPPDGVWPASAPFVDAAAYPTPRLRKWRNQSGVEGLFLGFWAPHHTGGTGTEAYTLTWAGAVQMYDKYAGAADDEYTSPTWGETYDADVTKSGYLKWLTTDIQKSGGMIIPSVGGANGPPLEQYVTDTDYCAEVYRKAVANYALHHLDFDIEGSALTDPEQRKRHVQTLLKMRKAMPDLSISHTFAVDIDGYNSHTLALLQEMAKQKYQPDMIQLMLMEMRIPQDGDYYDALRASTEHGVAQAASAFGWSREDMWRKLGLCPMFGANNQAVHDGRKVTTLEHMRRMVDEIAKPNQVATVSGWSMNRDYNQVNPHQQQESTAKCHVGSPFRELPNCTYVEQEHLAFSKIAAAYKRTS